ncbi:polysaccharide biosynthesis/export family protein [Amphibiibacter pelophylacis]|uniref:Polysaccharide biosynthesis/export family protein n=1 Tax=Amphibiibacter pelophylacis TaxID=1799477 RepID=A0ACC6NZA8_9BURK
MMSSRQRVKTWVRQGAVMAAGLLLGIGVASAQGVFNPKLGSPPVRSEAAAANASMSAAIAAPVTSSGASSSTAVAPLPLPMPVAPGAVAPINLSDYRLGPGDVITIRVFGEDDLSREKIRLTDGGTISVPAVGELDVRGQTLGDVERMVTKALKGRILVNPRVSVFVDEYRPFFINGMVEKPGGYPFQPGLTLRSAASLAGGFKDRASMSKLFIQRASDTQHQQVKVGLDAPIYPGDIITVEESFF